MLLSVLSLTIAVKCRGAIRKHVWDARRQASVLFSSCSHCYEHAKAAHATPPSYQVVKPFRFQWALVATRHFFSRNHASCCLTTSRHMCCLVTYVLVTANENSPRLSKHRSFITLRNNEWLPHSKKLRRPSSASPLQRAAFVRWLPHSLSTFIFQTRPMPQLRSRELIKLRSIW